MSSIPVVTQDNQYIQNIKIWETGILEDNEPGTKRGKGVQHLNSDIWIQHLGIFISENLKIMCDILRHTQFSSPEYEYCYLLNQSNMLVCKAVLGGLQTKESKEQFLMANWMAMAAAEVDTYNFSKYSRNDRLKYKRHFYESYLYELASTVEPKHPKPKNKFISADTRIDLIPTVALERMSIHNELCVIKWGTRNSKKWMTEGFSISSRIDSLKRHIDEAHHKKRKEDAIAHLLWNFMAIYHVLYFFPEQNDLSCFQKQRLQIKQKQKPIKKPLQNHRKRMYV